MPSGIERVRVKLQRGFNPDKHQSAIMKLITEAHGEGFEIESLDTNEGVAAAARQVAIAEVHQSAKDSAVKEVRLPRSVKLRRSTAPP